MDSIKICLAGDFCVRELNNLHFGESLKKLLANSDINVINMEGPVLCEGTRPISKSGPHLFQDSNVPTFLEENGFNAIAMANNHIMDYGEESLLKSKKSFTKAKTFGVGTFTEAYKIESFRVRNKTIGFLSLTQYEFGVLGYCQMSQDEVGSAWLCHPIVDELIINAKKKCDYLIVLPHAGLEYFEYPLPELRMLYRHFVNLGADAIVGGHPHISQCWESYNEKPIVYSLGNFCFDSISNRNKAWYTGLMVRLIIESDQIHIDVNHVFYDSLNRCVDISNDKNLSEQTQRTNEFFKDEQRYINAVNTKCLSLKGHYIDLFELSGIIRPTLKKLPRITLNTIKKAWCRDKRYDNSHLINNIRCETHRWIISRIYELSNRYS